MEIPFVGGSYEDYSPVVDAQVCQNLYPIADQQGGKPTALENIPGMILEVNLE